MIYRLAIPGPIEDVEEVRVLEWHGAPGRAFASGELMVELETHKAIIEVRAAQAGVLRQVLSPEGDWQKLGEPIALFSDMVDEPIPATLAELDDLVVEFDIS